MVFGNNFVVFINDFVVFGNDIVIFCNDIVVFDEHIHDVLNHKAIIHDYFDIDDFNDSGVPSTSTSTSTNTRL